MSPSKPHPDDHILDPWIKPLGSRWLLVGVATTALVSGICISIACQDWSWLNRFGGFVLVAGLLLTMSPFFSNGIYRSQSNAGTLSGLNSDNTPMITNMEDQKFGNNVALGIIVTVVGTLTNTFGDVLAGFIHGF